jgi:hypothetical protein
MSDKEDVQGEPVTFDESRSQIEKMMRQSRTNEPFYQNRAGRFSISRRILTCTDADALGQLFGMLIVVRAEADFMRDTVDYEAYSMLFPPIPMGCQPPKYYIAVHQGANGEWSFAVQDRTDSWDEAKVSFTYAEDGELPL